MPPTQLQTGKCTLAPRLGCSLGLSFPICAEGLCPRILGHPLLSQQHQEPAAPKGVRLRHFQQPGNAPEAARRAWILTKLPSSGFSASQELSGGTTTTSTPRAYCSPQAKPAVPQADPSLLPGAGALRPSPPAWPRRDGGGGPQGPGTCRVLGHLQPSPRFAFPSGTVVE